VSSASSKEKIKVKKHSKERVKKTSGSKSSKSNHSKSSNSISTDESNADGELLFEEINLLENESIKTESKTIKSPKQSNPNLKMSEPESNLFSLDSRIHVNKTNPEDLYKIIIVGDTYVGKSAFLNSLENSNSRWRMVTQPTIHTDFKIMWFNVNDSTIGVQFWDTAGQERFRALNQVYYRDWNAAIIMYSIDDKKSFSSVQLWHSELLKHGGTKKGQILLVGNKCDLEENRSVNTELGIEYAKNNEIDFIETSALKFTNCEKAMQITLQGTYKRKLLVTEETMENKLSSEKKEEESSCCS